MKLFYVKNDLRAKWTIYKHVSDKCWSVGNYSGILTVVCHRTDYTSLCRGLEYLIKVWYIILVDLNVVKFLIFETVCLGRSKTLLYVWKIYLKNERHYLCLVAHIFTNLSQNACLINIHTLIYWYARYNCKLCNALWFYCVFWVFSYIFDDHSCLNCCIFIKLSQIICLININILSYQHLKCNYRLWKVLRFHCVF